MTYPDLVQQELRRLDLEWPPWTDDVGNRHRRPPRPIPTVTVSPDGKETATLLDPLKADLIEFARAMEYHRRAALRLLQRFQADPTPEAARQAAEHMLLANLACEFLNQAVGQAPEGDLPFPRT